MNQQLDIHEVRKLIQTRMRSLRIKSQPEYFEEMIADLIMNKKVPLEALNDLLESPVKTGITKFDRIYEVTGKLAYPDYSEKLKKVSGLCGTMKMWKVNTPQKYKVGHVLIKAESYQDAFALACDYVLRIHLRLFHELPYDLTVKVTYCSEKFLRKHYGVKEINKKRQRQIRNTKDREFTERQIKGLALSALGHPPNDPKRSIARYHDKTDIDILRKRGVTKSTAIEKESFYKDIDNEV